VAESSIFFSCPYYPVYGTSQLIVFHTHLVGGHQNG
jgi:hypothetical protein